MKVRYNAAGTGRHEMEHHGITFRFSEEFVIDTLRQHHLDVLALVADKIDMMVQHAQANGDSLDFSVKVRITKDVTPHAITESFHVEKIAPWNGRSD